MEQIYTVCSLSYKNERLPRAQGCAPFLSINVLTIRHLPGKILLIIKTNENVPTGRGNARYNPTE